MGQRIRIWDFLAQDRNRLLDPRIDIPQKPKTVQYRLDHLDNWSQGNNWAESRTELNNSTMDWNLTKTKISTDQKPNQYLTNTN